MNEQTGLESVNYEQEKLDKEIKHIINQAIHENNKINKESKDVKPRNIKNITLYTNLIKKRDKKNLHV